MNKPPLTAEEYDERNKRLSDAFDQYIGWGYEGVPPESRAELAVYCSEFLYIHELEEAAKEKSQK